MPVKQKRKQSKAYGFFVEEPVFRGLMYVVIGKAEDAKALILKKFTLNNPDVLNVMEVGYAGSTTDFVNEANGQHTQIIWISEDFKHKDKHQETAYIVSTIQHESLHAVSILLRLVGIEHTEATEEVYAYMHTWLTEQIYEGLAKRK